MQTLTLTTPIVFTAPPSVTGYSVVRFLIEKEPFPRVVILVKDNNGQRYEQTYSDEHGGTVAAQIISALNTANLTLKSLQHRILERLAADGVLGVGTVTGVPD